MISFWRFHVHPKIPRGSPRARALNEGGRVRFGDFRPLSLRISEINDIGWPWNDLGRQLCTQLHYTHGAKPLKFEWRPILSCKKCSTGILVSSKGSLIRIFTGVRWRGGVKWEWGRRGGEKEWNNGTTMKKIKIKHKNNIANNWTQQSETSLAIQSTLFQNQHGCYWVVTVLSCVQTITKNCAYITE